MVSVIVPVYDSEETISETLYSLLSQTYTDYEILIVDDSSEDRSYQIAKEFAKRDGRVKVFRMAHNMGAPYCMNFATEKSSSNWMGIIDADAQAPPNWLEMAKGKFEGADIIGGPYEINPRNLFEQASYALEGFPQKEIIFDENNYRLPCLAGTNFFYSKKAFQIIGGFDEDIRVGYDRLFQCKALDKGMKVKYSPDLKVCHPASRNLKEFLQRTIRFRKWDLMSKKRHRLMGKISGRSDMYFIYWLFFSAISCLAFGWKIGGGISLALLLGGIISYLISRLGAKSLKLSPLFFLLILVGKTISLMVYLLRPSPENHWRQSQPKN